MRRLVASVLMRISPACATAAATHAGIVGQENNRLNRSNGVESSISSTTSLIGRRCYDCHVQHNYSKPLKCLGLSRFVAGLDWRVALIFISSKVNF